jgi:hypothetical protein
MEARVIAKMKRERETAQKIEQSIDTLTDMVNVMGAEEKVGEYIAQCIMNQHRTLQQSLWKALFTAVTAYGDKAHTDLRNEQSKAVCRKLSRVMEDGDCYLPFI